MTLYAPKMAETPQYVFVLQREILLGAQFTIPWITVCIVRNIRVLYNFRNHPYFLSGAHIPLPTPKKTFEEVLAVDNIEITYREVYKGLYVVVRNFFLLLLNCSAWPCLGPA